MKGFLITGAGSPLPILRVYGPDHSGENPDYIDYEVHHSDLEVEIVGEFDLYERDGKHIIDHSREVLGKPLLPVGKTPC
jgi:hypothetical protein